ncbi:MAG: GNAT family N-acetyltransferase [Burkholderiaceae bacterium]
MNYTNSVPPFAELWLNRLYGNIFSSLAHYRIYDGISGIHTYIAWKDEQVLAVLLYRKEGAQVRILNEAARLPASEIERFAQYMFKSCPAVSVISLHAVALEGSPGKFPLQRFNCLEDIILRLPAGTEEYLAHLGKSTRSYLNRYQNKLKRDFPSMCQVTYFGDEIKESHIQEILDMNRARMEGKGKLTPWTKRDERCMFELARLCGMVNVIMIDGRICAGTLNYRVNENFFLEIIAHAPEYNDYRLGMICCFATISQCIALGGKEYHFLWGQSEYKYRLGGVQQDLEHVSLFRSRIHMLKSMPLVAGNIYQSCKRKMQVWSKEARRRDSIFARPLDGLIFSIDALKLFSRRCRSSLAHSGSGRAADSVNSNSSG